MKIIIKNTMNLNNRVLTNVENAIVFLHDFEPKYNIQKILNRN
jgi:hypothetical protein